MLKFEDFYLLNEGNRLMGEFKFGFELEAYWRGGGEGYGRYDEDAYSEAVDDWAGSNWRDFKTEAVEYYQDEIMDRASGKMSEAFNDNLDDVKNIFKTMDFESIAKKKFSDTYIQEWVVQVVKELEDQYEEEELQGNVNSLAKEFIKELEDSWQEEFDEDSMDEYYEDATDYYMDDIKDKAITYATEYAYENAVIDVPQESASIDNVPHDDLVDFIGNYFEGGEIKSDSSLTENEDEDDVGFEYASSILDFTPLNLQNLAKMLSDLDDNEIYTNSSCGFHVHISFPDMLRKEGFWIQLCLATDEAAQKKFIQGENPLQVKFFQPTYAKPGFLNRLEVELADKDWGALSDTLYDDEKYLVLALTHNKDLEWRGPRNILKFTNDNEDNIERAKKFVILLRDMVKWISDCLDKNDINGISKKVILASIEQYSEIKKSGKYRFQAFDKPQKGKLAGLDKETIRIITTKYPWFLKLNIKRYHIFGSNEKLKVSGGTISGGGPWVDGEYRDGKISNIIWQHGSAINCDCENVTWKNGTFLGKENFYLDEGFANSTFEYGNFLGGNFVNSTFVNGIFNNDSSRNIRMIEASFIGSTFKGGIWQNGRWIYGEWLGGTWKEGIIMFRHENDIFECISDISPAKFFKSMSYEAIMQTRNVTKVNDQRKFHQFSNKLATLS